MKTQRRNVGLGIWAGVAVALGLAVVAAAPLAYASGPTPIELGTAAPFAVLAGTPSVTNTGPSTIVGDLGISPAASVTGFPPGTVTGTIHAADAVALQAKIDLGTAYDQAASLAVTANHGTLGGLTLVGGVYNAGGVTLDLTGTLTLDGENDPSSVWVFQATSDLVTASSSTVALINGASACNVFWQVTSSATLGSGSTFVGTIMALTSITMDDGVTMTGRALARNGAVTLINDRIDASTCSAATAPTPVATPVTGPSPTIAATPVSSVIPNTASRDQRSPVSWPVFLSIIALALVMMMVIVKVTLAAERRR